MRGERKEKERWKAFLFPLLLRLLRRHPLTAFSNLSSSRYRPTTPSSASPPSSFELPAFCGGSTTSRRSDARRGLVGSHATLPKRYLTWPAVSYRRPHNPPPPLPAPTMPFQPFSVSLPSPRSRRSFSSSRRYDDARSARKTLRVGCDTIRPPREKIARLCFKRYGTERGEGGTGVEKRSASSYDPNRNMERHWETCSRDEKRGQKERCNERDTLWNDSLNIGL